MLIWILALATMPVEVPENPTAQTPETLKIDILVKQPEPECGQAEGDEIIVCAEKADNERHRLRPFTNDKELKNEPLKAEVQISENATLAGENEAASIGPGLPSNRVMVRLKVAF